MEERIMKKYFSNIFALAALLMTGAAFAACSSDDNISEQPANPSGEKTYTLTVNASKGANASTRALELSGTKLLAKWAESDELSVFKAENRTGCIPANSLGTISPVAGSISADGKSATFTGNLTGSVVDGDKLMLVYHYNAFSVDAFASQTGTLESASALDCATAQVTASVSGSDITIKETSATFTTHTAMLKLTLTTDGTTTINPTALKMSMSAGSLTLKEFSFAPTADTYSANGNGVLYFALPSAADVAAGLSTTTDALSVVTITYAATVGSDVYTATKTGYTFAAGKYYAGTLTMAPAKVPATVTTAPQATAARIAVSTTKALVSAGAAEGGTMMYAVTTTNTQPTSTDGFSATIPTAEGRAAGNYYVWYYAKGDADHSDSEIAGPVSVTMEVAAFILGDEGIFTNSRLQFTFLAGGNNVCNAWADWNGTSFTCGNSGWYGDQGARVSVNGAVISLGVSDDWGDTDYEGFTVNFNTSNNTYTITKGSYLDSNDVTSVKVNGVEVKGNLTKQ